MIEGKKASPLVAADGAEGGMIVYNATRAALSSIALRFVSELLPRSIRFNAGSPGFLDAATNAVPGYVEERDARLPGAFPP